MGNKLYLLRRGESISDSPGVGAPVLNDHNFLSRHGETQARLAGLFFSTEDINFTVAFTSPSLAARHTTSIVLNEQPKNLRPPVSSSIAFDELRIWQEASRVEEELKATVLPALHYGNVLLVSHYYVMRAIFQALATPDNTDSCGGRCIGYCTPFVWDTDAPGRILTVDPNVHYSRDNSL